MNSNNSDNPNYQTENSENSEITTIITDKIDKTEISEIDYENSCVICYQKFEQINNNTDDPIIVCNVCHNKFHETCYNERKSILCPICRMPIFTKTGKNKFVINLVSQHIEIIDEICNRIMLCMSNMKFGYDPKYPYLVQVLKYEYAKYLNSKMEEINENEKNEENKENETKDKNEEIKEIKENLNNSNIFNNSNEFDSFISSISSHQLPYNPYLADYNPELPVIAYLTSDQSHYEYEVLQLFLQSAGTLTMMPIPFALSEKIYKVLIRTIRRRFGFDKDSCYWRAFRNFNEAIPTIIDLLETGLDKIWAHPEHPKFSKLEEFVLDRVNACNIKFSRAGAIESESVIINTLDKLTDKARKIKEIKETKENLIKLEDEKLEDSGDSINSRNLDQPNQTNQTNQITSSLVCQSSLNSFNSSDSSNSLIVEISKNSKDFLAPERIRASGIQQHVGDVVDFSQLCMLCDRETNPIIINVDSSTQKHRLYPEWTECGLIKVHFCKSCNRAYYINTFDEDIAETYHNDEQPNNPHIKFTKFTKIVAYEVDPPFELIKDTFNYSQLFNYSADLRTKLLNHIHADPRLIKLMSVKDNRRENYIKALKALLRQPLIKRLGIPAVIPPKDMEVIGEALLPQLMIRAYKPQILRVLNGEDISIMNKTFNIMQAFGYDI